MAAAALLLGAALAGCGQPAHNNPPPSADGGLDGTVDHPPVDATADADTGLADTGLADTGLADTGAADTGAADTGAADTGLADTGLADTGVADTGTADTGTADTGTADTGTADTGVADTGGTDTGVADTGVADTGVADTGGGPLAFSENFDEVTAPALPSGWTSKVLSGNGAGPWVTITDFVDTSPNSAFVDDANSATDIVLVSPTFTVGSATAVLTFENYYYTEVIYDGGVLEISIAGSAFADIVAAGGSFIANGYNQTIPYGFGSPIAGRQAWSGNPGGFISTSVRLPPSAAGKSVRLRWRMASDQAHGGVGWWIDTVRVTN